MALAERKRARNVQVATGTSIEAPVRGWNARDPIAKMKPGDAYQMDNWVPRPGYVEIRRGFLSHVVGFDPVPETILVYRSGSLDEAFAVSGGDVFDVTSRGELAAAVHTGLTNSRLQYINFANDAGAFLIAVNGADDPIKYDGSAWATTTITGSAGSITLDPTKLVDVVSHKRRLWFAEDNSLRVWYLDADAIAGAAGLLDLGPVLGQGGYIAGMGVWSVSGGLQATDAMIAFVSSQGQVAVYAGEDPSDAASFSLVGVYSIGKPLGRRAVFQTASDLVVITHDGAVPLSQVRQARQAGQAGQAQQADIAITSRIQLAFAKAARSYGVNFGWEAMLYPTGQVAIINVPLTELGYSRQFVQNSQTGAWCQFVGIDAVTWGYFNGQPYFAGRDGAGRVGVFRWDVGGSDNGFPIQCDLVTAFGDFGSPGRLKQFTEVRPLLQTSSNVTPYIDILVDYRVTSPVSVPDTATTSAGSRWGVARWGGAAWSSASGVQANWTSAAGLGYVAAARARIIADAENRGEVYDALWDAAEWDLARWDSDDPALYANVDAALIGFDLLYTAGASL